jgi:hypothetical protein
MTLALNNSNDFDVTFTFSVEPITDPEGDKSLPESCFDLPESVTVPAGGKRYVDITFTAPSNAEPAIYGTTLVISSNAGTLRVPVIITIPLTKEGVITGSIDDDKGLYAQGDWIYYKIRAYDGFRARLEWSNSANDLDLYLFAPNGVLVNSSDSSNAYEEVSLSSTAYDEYWLAVHAYSLNNEENYRIIVNYTPQVQISPSSWQGSVKEDELKNVTFTITNNDVPKNVNLSVGILSPGSNYSLAGSIGTSGYAIVWNVSSSDVANAKYVNVTLEWDNTSNDLDLALFYWNGSAWVKTRFESVHDNAVLNEAVEKLENVDVQHYVRTYSRFGVGVANNGALQTFNLTINFTDMLPWDAASVEVTALSLNANDVKQVNVTINGS